MVISIVWWDIGDIYIHTWTVLEPHNFRPLWIFGCGPKNHFWAKSDGFNDTVLVSKSWCFASFLRHFASYFWSFQMWLTEGKFSNCSIFGRSLLFSPDQNKMQLLDVQVWKESRKSGDLDCFRESEREGHGYHISWKHGFAVGDVEPYRRIWSLPSGKLT